MRILKQYNKNGKVITEYTFDGTTVGATKVSDGVDDDSIASMMEEADQRLLTRQEAVLSIPDMANAIDMLLQMMMEG